MNLVGFLSSTARRITRAAIGLAMIVTGVILGDGCMSWPSPGCSR